MSARTPGPWRQGPQTYQGAEVIIGNGDYIMVRMADPDAELEAARFIAAAPDTAAERDRLRAVNAELLAALRDVLAEHDGGGHFDTSVLHRARAAIARAEGR